MSGLFKQLNNFVARSAFSQPNNYLLRSTNATLHPTAYYYQGDQLQPGHNLDIFQLSVTAASLTHQANDYLDILKQVQSNSVRQEVQNRLNQNIQAINSYFSQIVCQFSFNQDLTIQSVADISYVLAYGPQKRDDAQKIVEERLLPVLRGPKLHYASTQNLQDIINSLHKLNLNDNQLLSQLLNELNSREHDFVNVKAHGWATNQYQKCCSKCNWNVLSCSQNFFREYALSGGSGLSSWKLQLSEWWDTVSFRIVNPFLFRESRINRRFQGRNDEVETYKFLETLEHLEKQQPELQSVIQKVRERYQ